MRKAALLVMQSGGVVRQLENHGENTLAYKIRMDHEWFNVGRQWTMQFDSPPTLVGQLKLELKLDPLVIRSAVMKVSSKDTLTAKVPDAVSRDQLFEASTGSYNTGKAYMSR